MKKYLAIAAGLIGGAVLLLVAAPAMARVNVDINVGLPGIYMEPEPVYVQPRPVYVQPEPVYVQPEPVYAYPPPVYVQPRPIYVQPRPVYVYPHPYYFHRERENHWREHELRARYWQERRAEQGNYLRDRPIERVQGRRNGDDNRYGRDDGRYRR
jgi:hypothetical protein